MSKQAVKCREARGPRLSRKQQEFADRLECGTAVQCVERAVCFYRELRHETVRWIVDADGCVLDWRVFRTGV